MIEAGNATGMNARNTRNSDGTDSAAPGQDETGRRRAAIAGFAGTRHLAVIAIGALFALSPTISSAQDPDPADADFMELLEYMGSWEGAEEDWVLFLGDANDPDSPAIDIEQLTSEAEAEGPESAGALAIDLP